MQCLDEEAMQNLAFQYQIVAYKYLFPFPSAPLGVLIKKSSFCFQFYETVLIRNHLSVSSFTKQKHVKKLKKMGRAKIEIKKIENATSRNVTFCNRSAGLFKKAKELATLCDAEVAVIHISSDGNISDYASSNMQGIIARLNRRLESSNLPALEVKLEGPEKQVPEGVDVLRQEAQKLKSKRQKLQGKDITHMDLHELLAREEQLNEEMLCIMDRKGQILKEQLEQSRTQQQVLQENQTLKRQVEELRGFFPSTSYTVPLSVYLPETERNIRPDKKLLPSTSFAAPLAIDNSPETERNVGPADKEFLPSTSFATPLALDDSPETEHNVEPADKDLDTTLALGPTWGWSKNEDTRE